VLKSKLLFFILILNMGLSGYAQQKAVSIPKSYSIKPRIEPPVLILEEGSLQFFDANANLALDANETAEITFALRNTGFGDANNLIAYIEVMGSYNDIQIEKQIPLDKVPISSVNSYRIPISSGMNTTKGMLTLRVNIKEPNGFDPEPFSIRFETRAFLAPNITVTDYSLTGEGKLEAMKPIELQFMIQNIGQGEAENISTEFVLPENVVLLSGDHNNKFERLQVGDSKILKYSFIINARYTDSILPLSLTMQEKYGRYANNWSQKIPLNRRISPPRELVLTAQEEVIRVIPTASFKSDVDVNIPRTEHQNHNRYALVIGNEDYTGKRTTLNTSVNVDFAREDAMVFAQYLESSFGLPPENIKLLTDATYGEMLQGLSWLENLARAAGPETELYFYYSGHGLPTESGQKAYLIPIDISGDKPELGIALQEIYDGLARYPVKKSTVILDACFSGGARNEALIARKSVRIQPKGDILPDNLIVMASSSGNQSSAVFREKNHGFFTYYLLKGIQTLGVQTTYGNLFNYIRKEVDLETARQGIMQQPQIITAPNSDQNWQMWSIE
jgi:hypothetical protein